MKETITYLIKLKNTPFDLYISNRPAYPEDTGYTRNKNKARDFNGLDDVSIDMTEHIAVKKTVKETTEYEEVQDD
ncbi:DUF2483 family protein [Staphylococcus nepalensis]|uniref:DUF2483 family protein n=1 Tax=Staphylococcus nepalensis TaxID=214473 RepID=UPI003018E4A9